MKKIALKKVKIDYDEDVLKHTGAPEFLEYRSTIMGLLKTPKDPQKGADFEETAQAIPIWSKFRKYKMPDIGDGEILLEDAEHKFVVECLKNARFIQRSIELYDMVQSVIDAPDHLVVEQKSG